MAIPVMLEHNASPEQSGGFGPVIAHALQTYQGLTKAKYARRQQEADIFAKEIGPLAALASSPNFTGFNPQVQKMIAQRMAEYLGNTQAGGSHGSMGSSAYSADNTATPGYASDEDIYNRLSQSAETTEGAGGHLATKASNWAGIAKKHGAPDFLVQLLGGTHAINEKGVNEGAQAEAEQRLVLKGYTPERARRAVKIKEGEDVEAWAKRVKPLFIEKNQEKENVFKNIGSKIEEDERARLDAQHTADAFKAEGFNVTPEMVLEAQAAGMKTKNQFRDYLKANKANNPGEE